MLYKHTHKLNPEGLERDEAIAQRDEDTSVDKLKFLFGSYTPSCWWWEVFETGRRLSLTGALMIFPAGSAIQLFVGTWICLIALLMYRTYNPFIDAGDNRLALGAQLQIYLLILTGMLMNHSGEKVQNDSALGALLVFTTLAIYFLSFGAKCFTFIRDSRPGVVHLKRWSKFGIDSGKREADLLEETEGGQLVSNGRITGFVNADPMRAANAGEGSSELEVEGDPPGGPCNNNGFRSPLPRPSTEVRPAGSNNGKEDAVSRGRVSTMSRIRKFTTTESPMHMMHPWGGEYSEEDLKKRANSSVEEGDL